LAGVTTSLTIDLMRDLGEFAQTVRARDLGILPYWRVAMYTLNFAVIIPYIWPIVVFLRHGTDARAPLVVQRRVTSAPLVIAGMGFGSWALSVLFFPAITLYHFGRWTPALLSQHVFSPIVNGFLASTTSYLLIDLVFRRMVVPRVFPTGRLADVPGSLVPGVSARLFLFLVAVAFIPLFTMLGLVRAARVRVGEGFAADAVLESLTHASTVTFLLYVALGIGLTLVLAWSLTRPLREMAAGLRRVQSGDLEVRVPVDSSDEVGALEDGVNALVSTLRDRERILQTFGRVVEPSVRDRLLAGAVGTGGELRTATVLFCDLHGFTAMAERTRPVEVVATLNAFFTALTAWVRQCGGFVDKFIGDAMLVVFGLFDADALPDLADASRGRGDASRDLAAAPTDAAVSAGGAGAAAALRCALGMRACLDGLNTTRAAQGLAPLAVSVGVHTGEVLAGTIGAADRHEYTVIGDTVNVAARLQQLCKEQDRAVLVSATAYELARAAGFDGALTIRDSVSLRGRSEPVGVFAVA
jgi:adenylate cyclase